MIVVNHRASYSKMEADGGRHSYRIKVDAEFVFVLVRIERAFGEFIDVIVISRVKVREGNKRRCSIATNRGVDNTVGWRTLIVGTEAPIIGIIARVREHASCSSITIKLDSSFIDVLQII